mmetsp:Transcript_3310/g.9403  ORF Transcript_3310/g.9403 Transcript_3310/m.9403 type:complete len:381 (-) Transcript_3310:423-1565(-)
MACEDGCDFPLSVREQVRHSKRNGCLQDYLGLLPIHERHRENTFREIGEPSCVRDDASVDKEEDRRQGELVVGQGDDIVQSPQGKAQCHSIAHDVSDQGHPRRVLFLFDHVQDLVDGAIDTADDGFHSHDVHVTLCKSGRCIVKAKEEHSLFRYVEPQHDARQTEEDVPDCCFGDEISGLLRVVSADGVGNQAAQRLDESVRQNFGNGKEKSDDDDGVGFVDSKVVADEGNFYDFSNSLDDCLQRVRDGELDDLLRFDVPFGNSNDSIEGGCDHLRLVPCMFTAAHVDLGNILLLGQRVLARRVVIHGFGEGNLVGVHGAHYRFLHGWRRIELSVLLDGGLALCFLLVRILRSSPFGSAIGKQRTRPGGTGDGRDGGCSH